MKKIYQVCISKYKISILNSFICSFCLNLIGVMMPLVLSVMIDEICQLSNDYYFVGMIFLTYSILLISYIFFDYAYAFNWQNLHNEMINRELSTNVLNKLLNSNSQIFFQKDKGELLTIISGDIDEVLYSIQLNIIQYGSSLLMLAFALCGIWIINPIFGIVILILNCIPKLYIALMKKRSIQVGKEYRDSYIFSENQLIDMIYKYKSIFLLNIEHKSFKYILNNYKATIYKRISKDKDEIIKKYFCNFINNITIFISFIVSIWISKTNVFTLGEF